MNDFYIEIRENTYWLTLNRINKHNAFDDEILGHIQKCLDEAIANPLVRVIVIKADGKHFSAGADLSWMKRMASYNEQDNVQDALVLAKVMYTLHSSPKPTIAMVHGCAFGGGAGIAAACDLAIASDTAQFCFSEVKLGLIPAVISPYVIKAIGERASKALFMSAELFNAQVAQNLGLVQHCVPESELLEFTRQYAEKICHNAPTAVQEAKQLVNKVSGKVVDSELVNLTAEWIAKKRISPEGQEGLRAFLNKEPPKWNH